MVDAMPSCVWGWFRPSRASGSSAGQAGGLVKGEPDALRRVWATSQTWLGVASTI